MPAKSRKKMSRHRGSHTHSVGSKKKGRGSGNKGGVGMAGTGKRSHSKKPRFWHMRYFGRFGRHSLNEKPGVINVGDLDSLGKKPGVIDLGHHGITKLLGKGKTVFKLEVTVFHASTKAVKKIVAKKEE